MATMKHLTRLADRIGRAGATLRGARLLHPRGRSFHGTLTVTGSQGAGRFGVPLLDRPARYPVTIRFSKGTPTPAGWPDILGVAVRIHLDPAGPVDVLLSTTAGRGPGLRRVPLPRRRFDSVYTSVSAYRTPAGRRLHLGATSPAGLGSGLDTVALAAADGAGRLELAVAGRRGWWRPWGSVSFGEPLSARDDAALAFDPITYHPVGLRLTGALQRLRHSVYNGSRNGRGVSLPARSSRPVADNAPAGPHASDIPR